MHYFLRVTIRHTRQKPHYYRSNILFIELALKLYFIKKTTSAYVLQHDEDELRILEVLEYLHDVWMVKASQNIDLIY